MSGYQIFPPRRRAEIYGILVEILDKESVSENTVREQGTHFKYGDWSVEGQQGDHHILRDEK